MKKIKDFIQENKLILLILSLSLLIRLIFFFNYHQIWWDSAVYIGMGKYIFSLGKQGLWEPIRPIVWPIILGFFWKLRLNPIFFGKLLINIMSFVIICLTFYITKKLYNEKTALIASVLVSFSSIFFFFGFRLYTEIPTLFFVLIAFYFYLKRRLFFTGFFLSLSFLTKFPAGIFFICFVSVILWKKQFKKMPFLFYGFILPLLPYLILNQSLYNNALFPFISAIEIIKNVLGCTVLRKYGWYSYLFFILKDNILNLFVVLGIYYSAKKYRKDKILLILLLFLLPLLYFMQLSCREHRYIILFLPFLSILTAQGILKFGKLKKQDFSKILILTIIISLCFSLTYYLFNETRNPVQERENFYKFIEGQPILNEVWITNPIINLYLTKKAYLLYYPVYDINTVFNFKQYLKYHNISYIFIDTCGGGMSCAPDDDACQGKTKEFIASFPKYGFWLVYNESFGNCSYQIFRK